MNTIADIALLGTLIMAEMKFSPERQAQLHDLANSMFTMYTQNGFPPDIFFDGPEATKSFGTDEKLFILNHYQLSLQHKRLSNIGDARLEALRRRNRETIRQFLTTGEVGLY